MDTILARVNSINNKVVDVHAAVLGSPYFLYVCWVIDLVELPGVIAAHNLITWCIYISQTVIQLVALPSLGAKANREGARAEMISARIDNHASIAALDAEEIKSLLLESHEHLADIKSAVIPTQQI